ncbi:MAG: formylglycine-generating enzyme family protein [Deltaproteobacteria bacterium]|nr:formylglycine-generating enzyme family protein [Deltaproteobacteria bacterium]
MRRLVPFLMILFALAFTGACSGSGDPASGDDDTADDDDLSDDDDTGDDDDTNAFWISLPGGSFAMGCVPGDADCAPDEQPRHPVHLAAFAITAAPITQAQYAQVMGDRPSWNMDCDECPVEQVTWAEASHFCAALGARLPAEAEWEYAARGGTETRFVCGDDESCLDGAAWYLDNAGGATHPVAEKSANAFGLFDMSGNVWEWTADWYAEGAYAAGAPPENGTERVLRGGAWNNETAWLRVSARNHDAPEDRSGAAGFRCVRDE